ncbi:D-alanyl-D-alanine carboxypeptidase family protein [Brevibacillus sp. H7]|uniref:D-alanyl-D-alanine carboxypeptidase family protein n=1 Tax=Brevibacillus sp. H7 TaxID=3349138 RepID=UPI0037F1BB54
MRFFLTLILLLTNTLFGWGSGSVSAQASDELTAAAINGESAILIDGTTGQVLFQKNPHVTLYPASITKIATGIYAIENGNPDDIVTVSKKARYEDGTRVYLGEGEQVSLKKLEYGLLMHSGNDAATAIAEHLAGTTEKFAERLNEYLAEKVGVTETHFANAHGLHDPNHYTTAADMAKIAQYAMKNPIFREIVATKRLPWDGREWKSELINHNKMLWRYEGATGIKNGFTDEARHTLVVSAKRGGSEFIAVTMKASSSALAYQDVTQMLDYGFAHYETRQVAKAGDRFTLATAAASERREEFTAPSDLFVTVPIGSEPQIEVTPQGMLRVQAGTFTQEFSLKRKEQPEIPARLLAISSSDQTGSESQTARYAILFTWLLLNIMLVFYVVARAKKRRRSTSHQDWRRRVG